MSTNHPFVSAHSSLCLHDRQSPARADVERFIQQRFALAHGALIRDFLPTLVSCGNGKGELMAAAGFQLADAGSLFLEAYLDTPIERCLARLEHGDCRRDQIVEVGNLATRRPGQARVVIAALSAWFNQHHLQWAVLTLTPTLMNSFHRLGLELHRLADARQGRLIHSNSHWGRYYEQHPQVVAVSIPASAAQLRLAVRSARPVPATGHRAMMTGEHSHA